MDACTLHLPSCKPCATLRACCPLARIERLLHKLTCFSPLVAEESAFPISLYWRRFGTPRNRASVCRSMQYLDAAGAVSPWPNVMDPGGIVGIMQGDSLDCVPFCC